jgi:UDP-N-acetylmuramoylalanine--D-glutamate ligase
MQLPFAQGKTYAMLGLGKTGQATAASLIASGATVVAWDDKEESRVAFAQAVQGALLQPMDAWPWKTLECVVMSPGIPLYFPTPHPVVAQARRHGVPISGDIDLLHQAQPQARYIAITGTNGKSTTTSLIGHILSANGVRCAVGGNLGTAVLALEEMGEGGTYVLELSSYQLDLVQRARFDIAVLLNFSPDHLDRHGSMDGYIEAKKRIFHRQQATDTAIVGVDDAYAEALCRAMLFEEVQKVLPISVSQTVKQGVYVSKDGVLHNAQVTPTEQASLQGIVSLQGGHNWQNAAAAYAACRAHGLSHDAVMEAMRSFPGLEHRMQWLGKIGAVAYVNDSKATNADAAEKALKTYDDIFWILGGVPKEGGIEPLLRYFPKLRHAYLIGEAADAFARTLKGHVPTTQCGTLERAFLAASAAAKTSGLVAPVVLLSPACASFDQFKNFEARGAAFMTLVEQLRTGATDAA